VRETGTISHSYAQRHIQIARIARSIRRRRHGENMNSDQYELLAKTTLVVAKLLGAVVVLTRLYDLPKADLLGVLVVATIGFSTVSTMAWMSR